VSETKKESTKKDPVTRLYIVNDVDSGNPIALVRATSVVKAERYITAKKFDVKYAEQTDVVRATKAGLEEESVAESDPAE
jgi:hypothetical protein